MEEDQENIEEMRRCFEESRKKRDASSSKLGEYMLNGWALMAESCPQPDCSMIPLVCKKGSPYYCVSCGGNFTRSTTGTMLANGEYKC